jgi:hypothetical protein
VITVAMRRPDGTLVYSRDHLTEASADNDVDRLKRLYPQNTITKEVRS